MHAPVQKPFYILDPLTLVDHQRIALSTVEEIKKIYGQQDIGIPVARFDEAAAKSFHNGMFDFQLFKDFVRKSDNGYPLFSDQVVQDALREVIKTHLGYSIENHALAKLRETGNVSILVSEQHQKEQHMLQEGIVTALKERVPKEVKDIKDSAFSLEKILRDNSLTIVRQTDKKRKEDKTIAFGDYVDSHKLGNEVHIVSSNADTLTKIHKNTAERAHKPIWDLVHIGKAETQFAQPLPETVRRISSLRDLVPQRVAIEGRTLSPVPLA